MTTEIQPVPSSIKMKSQKYTFCYLPLFVFRISRWNDTNNAPKWYKEDLVDKALQVWLGKTATIGAWNHETMGCLLQHKRKLWDCPTPPKKKYADEAGFFFWEICGLFNYPLKVRGWFLGCVVFDGYQWLLFPMFHLKRKSCFGVRYSLHEGCRRQDVHQLGTRHTNNKETKQAIHSS